MRNYIFEFKQEIALQRGLGVDELLILDYILKFMGSSASVQKKINNKPFGWISYSKLLSDLPILNIKERRLQKIFAGLEQKGIIERQTLNKKMFVYVNRNLLFCLDKELGEDYLTEQDKKMLKEQKDGENIHQFGEYAGVVDVNWRTNIHPIVNYYKNKIKVLLTCSRVQEINTHKFIQSLQETLQSQVSPLTYDLCLKNLRVTTICNNLIVLSAGVTSIIETKLNDMFCEALKKALQFVFEDLK